jgi:tetratricopeptide (TPR) repeat protein
LAAKKIKKKDLKKPDEFITQSTRILRWCNENMRLVLGAGGGLLLVVLLVGAVFLLRANREAKARAMYDNALAIYPVRSFGENDVGRYAAVAAKLKEVQEQYGSTKTATNALVDLGNVYFQEKEYDKAISCYQDFLDNVPAEHPLRDPVLVSLGATYEAKGSEQSAIEVYNRLRSKGTPGYQSQAQLCLGRVYEALGERNKAAGHYDAYLKEDPDSIFGQWLRTKLLRWQMTQDSLEQGPEDEEK